MVADKGCDSDPSRQTIRRSGAKPVIPARKGIRRRRHGRARYRLRNRVERFFNRVKHHRRVASRYEKTDCNYPGMLCLASLCVSFASCQHDQGNQVVDLIDNAQRGL